MIILLELYITRRYKKIVSSVLDKIFTIWWVFFKKIGSCFEKAKMDNHCSFLLNILLFIATMKTYKNTDYLNEMNN